MLQHGWDPVYAYHFLEIDGTIRDGTFRSFTKFLHARVGMTESAFKTALKLLQHNGVDVQQHIDDDISADQMLQMMRSLLGSITQMGVTCLSAFNTRYAVRASHTNCGRGSKSLGKLTNRDTSETRFPFLYTLFTHSRDAFSTLSHPLSLSLSLSLSLPLSSARTTIRRNSQVAR